MIINRRENLDLLNNQKTGMEAIDNAENQPIISVKEEIGNQINVIKEKAQLAQQKVSENLAVAAAVVHQKSDETQDVLDLKTDKINEFAHKTIERVNEFGHRAGEALVTSSDFVAKFDLAESTTQMKEKINENPAVSLTVAGIIGLTLGFLIGRTRPSI
jgi:ElaB/YqjD/DUF883 family membrane-anchored ribosome-binding protein